MTKIIRGKIESITSGQNMMGLHAFNLLISTEDKFIELLDYGYEDPDEWEEKDVGRIGIFKYGWGLFGRKELKYCKLEEYNSNGE